MFSTRLIVGAALMALVTAGAAAATKSAHKETRPTAKRLSGKQETLACRLGTEDRHARIAVVTIGGKVDSFAYYSKWKPRTCSIYLQRRGDMYSKWADNGDVTAVEIEKGAFLIENRKNEYHFVFRNVDRERYCGMDGMINGTLTIRKGSEACELGGDIMVEGTPLGQAWAKRDEDKAPVGLLPVTAQEVAKAPPDKSPSVTDQPAEAQAQPPAATPAAAAAPAGSTSASVTSQAAAPAAVQPAPTSAAATTTAAAPAAPAKPAETQSSGIGSFFRSFSQSRGPSTPTAGQSD